MYFSRRKKGHEGVKGTPVEDYLGIPVHDHEKTFYNYGAEHQECLAHVLRYLKESIADEGDRTWNKEMRSLMQEMIHYRNGLPEEAPPDTEKVKEYEEGYRAILRKAKEEYMFNHLLFRHDHRVPATNKMNRSGCSDDISASNSRLCHFLLTSPMHNNMVLFYYKCFCFETGNSDFYK